MSYDLTRLLERKNLFTLTQEQRLDSLFAKVRELENQIFETRQMIPTAEMLQAAMRAVHQAEWDQLEKLRDDVVKLLVVMVKNGVVTQDELNDAIASG